MSNAATEIKRLEDFTGDARLFRLSPPLRNTDYDDKTSQYEYVVVSATHAPYSGPETYIFPADSEGNVTSWSELEGSYRGGLSHVEALSRAGYQIAMN